MDLRCRLLVVFLVVLTNHIPKVHADEPFSLAETLKSGTSFRVDVRFSAEGKRDAEDPPAQSKNPQPSEKPQATGFPFRVTAHTSWLERVTAVDDKGQVSRAVRRIDDAEASINFFRGTGQTLVGRLRPELGLLIAELRGNELVVASAGGPLTRDELDLVHGPGDSFLLQRLLPPKPTSVGASWDVPPPLALAWSEYHILASSTLRATLEACDAQTARIAMAGVVKGSTAGASGSIRIDGQATFDRKSGVITRLVLDRAEVRQKGVIESALDVKSHLEVTRTLIETPAELSDTALADLPLEIKPQTLLIRTDAPGGQYYLVHDRDWYLCSDTERVIVLKRLDERGEMLAQCNLIVGPTAAPGRHQDVAQFRDDVRKAIGARFGRIVGEGELNDAAVPGFRYKLAIEGVEQEAGVVPLWYYYLIASPSGEQLVAIFTLSRGTEPRFGEHDLSLVGSLVWKSAAGPAAR